MSHEYRPGCKDWYDYEKQAWVQSGVYVRCGHVAECDCYGRAHAGEQANVPPTFAYGGKKYASAEG